MSSPEDNRTAVGLYTLCGNARKKLKEIMEEARSPCGMLVVKMKLGHDIAVPHTQAQVCFKVIS